jgi:molecular chaperone DnaK (HSP70)
LTLTRGKFEELASNLIDRCRVPVEQALKDAKLSTGEIDEIVMVGGSTRMPAVKELVKRVTTKDPNQTVNPVSLFHFIRFESVYCGTRGPARLLAYLQSQGELR